MKPMPTTIWGRFWFWLSGFWAEPLTVTFHDPDCRDEACHGCGPSGQEGER